MSCAFQRKLNKGFVGYRFCALSQDPNFWRNEAKSKDPMKSTPGGKPLARCAITPLDMPLPGVTAAQKFRRWKGLHFTLPLRMSGQGTSPRFQARQLDPDPRSPDRTLIIRAHGVRRQTPPVSREARKILRADAFQIVEGDTNGRHSFGRPIWNRSRPIPVRSRHPTYEKHCPLAG